MLLSGEEARSLRHAPLSFPEPFDITRRRIQNTHIHPPPTNPHPSTLHPVAFIKTCLRVPRYGGEAWWESRAQIPMDCKSDSIKEGAVVEVLGRIKWDSLFVRFLICEMPLVAKSRE